ncbi:MAG: hypothetical protein AB7U73_00785 [Pirellulales bacterium]
MASSPRGIAARRPIAAQDDVCVGGDYVLENLYALDDVKGMRFRASIANQIRDLPDGTKIRFRID